MNKVLQSIADGFLSISKGLASIFSWASPTSNRKNQRDRDDWASVGEDFKSVGSDLSAALNEYQDFLKQMEKVSHKRQDEMRQYLLERRNRWPLLSENEIKELIKQYLASKQKPKR